MHWPCPGFGVNAFNPIWCGDLIAWPRKRGRHAVFAILTTKISLVEVEDLYDLEDVEKVYIFCLNFLFLPISRCFQEKWQRGRKAMKQSMLVLSLTCRLSRRCLRKVVNLNELCSRPSSSQNCSQTSIFQSIFPDFFIRFDK